MAVENEQPNPERKSLDDRNKVTGLERRAEQRVGVDLIGGVGQEAAAVIAAQVVAK